LLKTKAGLWTSDEEWNFKTKDDLIYIENISNTKVLGATIDGEVILEDFKEDKAEQFWKKGEPNAEGYFTLENYQLPKLMTGISSSGLEIKGNLTCHNEIFQIATGFRDLF
jgi:threonine dehydratase